jgi:membrane-associated phospholipid phosphatase
MSVTGGLKPAAADGAAARLHWMRASAVQFLALFRRPPRNTVTPAWRTPARIVIYALATIAVISETMVFADAAIIRLVLHLPEGIVVPFNWVTDFGKSVRFLVPIALLLAVIAALASPMLTSMSQRMLAAVAVRLSFLFMAIALPGLVFTIVKRLIGRARPLVGGSLDPFLHHPLGWSVEYASLPSGHATDAAAVATAIGALWPWTRPFMWTYVVLIAISRVVLTAHFPSDVIAGAIVGAAGALLVRDWFAARGLAFTLAPDGVVRPMPGPSFARIKRVARHVIAP